MQSFRLSVLCSLLLAAALTGCDTTATQPADSQVFVESYQQAGAPLDTVWLTRTADARETITPSEAAVENAVVTIENLDNENTISYTEAGTPGVYVPASSPPTVETQTSYRLQVETNGGQTVTSTTTVPKAFTLENVENTTTAFQQPQGQPTFVLDPPDAESQQYEQDRQNVYFFTVEVPSITEADTSNFTPFYRDSYEADEDSIESFRVNTSGLLNQANFSSTSDGRVSVDLPWVGVAFFGTNRVGINLVDDNYYDFLRSESAQENAPPGEFPNVIEHVEGGTGIFASYVRAETTVQVQCDDAFLRQDFVDEYGCP